MVCIILLVFGLELGVGGGGRTVVVPTESGGRRGEGGEGSVALKQSKPSKGKELPNVARDTTPWRHRLSFLILTCFVAWRPPPTPPTLTTKKKHNTHAHTQKR